MYGCTTGSKLLFKYPFIRKPDENDLEKTLHLNNIVENTEEEDCSSECQDEATRDEMDQFLEFSEETIATILSTQHQSSVKHSGGSNFDVKINGLRFVGFVLDVDQQQNGSGGDQSNHIPINSFNISFILRTTASYSIVEMYFQLAAKICKSLRSEETRTRYMSQQVEKMHFIHEESFQMEGEDVHDKILEECSLAKSLEETFQMLHNTGIVEMFINNTMRVSFCLYHKVHAHSALGHPSVNFQDVRTLLNMIRPYHGLMVHSRDHSHVLASLNASCSSSIILFLRALQPTKSFQVIASDTHMSLNHVFKIARHLVAWGKAFVVYPLCDSNVYTISPNADLKKVYQLADDFQYNFSFGLSKILKMFSQPTALRELQGRNRPFEGNQEALMHIVVWMLKHKVLIQCHEYVYFICDPVTVEGSEMSFLEVRRCFERVAEKKAKSITMGDLPEACRRVFERMILPLKDKDLVDFFRLFKYFNGKHHLEDIMFNEDLRRPTLNAVIGKFAMVLETRVRKDSSTIFC